jgi:hypothetical protein
VVYPYPIPEHVMPAGFWREPPRAGAHTSNALVGVPSPHRTRRSKERYVAALGGTLKLIADFGDEQLKVA